MNGLACWRARVREQHTSLQDARQDFPAPSVSFVRHHCLVLGYVGLCVNYVPCIIAGVRPGSDTSSDVLSRVKHFFVGVSPFEHEGAVHQVVA